jgi:ABC-type lipoprotein export system ATPase subunit
MVGFSKELAVDHGRTTILVTHDRGIFRTTHRIVNLVDGVVMPNRSSTVRSAK